MKTDVGSPRSDVVLAFDSVSFLRAEIGSAKRQIGTHGSLKQFTKTLIGLVESKMRSGGAQT